MIERPILFSAPMVAGAAILVQDGYVSGMFEYESGSTDRIDRIPLKARDSSLKPMIHKIFSLRNAANNCYPSILRVQKDMRTGLAEIIAGLELQLSLTTGCIEYRVAWPPAIGLKLPAFASNNPSIDMFLPCSLHAFLLYENINVSHCNLEKCGRARRLIFK